MMLLLFLAVVGIDALIVFGMSTLLGWQVTFSIGTLAAIGLSLFGLRSAWR